MKPLFRLLVAALLVAALPLSGASAASDHTGTAAQGAPFEWTGAATVGTGLANMVPEDVPMSRECSKDPTFYCETALVGVDLTLTQDEIDAGKVRKRGSIEIKIDTPTVPVYDFDLRIYESDADGTQGALIQSVGDLDETPGEEAAILSAQGTVAEPVDYYLVEVIYFTSVMGSYEGHATVLGTPKAS